MKSRWLAGFSFVVGALLIGRGVLAASGIDTLRSLSDPALRITPSEIVAASELLPFLYLVALEGLVLGTIVLVCAAGIIVRRPWALRALMFASFGLAAVALIAIAMVPRSWESQGFFVLMSAALWWHFWGSRRGNASAL